MESRVACGPAASQFAARSPRGRSAPIPSERRLAGLTAPTPPGQPVGRTDRPARAGPGRGGGELVNPTGADLKRFLAEDDGRPVVMLNLLKFREVDRPSYERYAQEIRRFLEEVGAEIVYLGDCSTLVVGTEAHDRDAVLLVRY